MFSGQKNEYFSSTYPCLNPPSLNQILGKHTKLVENPPSQKRPDEKAEDTAKTSGDTSQVDREADQQAEEKKQVFGENVKHFEEGNSPQGGEQESQDFLGKISEVVSNTMGSEGKDKVTGTIENVKDSLTRGE